MIFEIIKKLFRVKKSFGGRELKALDKKEKACQICGKIFIASNKAKFCSNKCRQKNKYKKALESTKKPLKEKNED